jgi:hypothetical protein
MYSLLEGNQISQSNVALALSEQRINLAGFVPLGLSHSINPHLLLAKSTGNQDLQVFPPP